MDVKGVRRALRVGIARAAIDRDAPEFSSDVTDDQALEMRYSKDALELFDAAWDRQDLVTDSAEEPH